LSRIKKKKKCFKRWKGVCHIYLWELPPYRKCNPRVYFSCRRPAPGYPGSDKSHEASPSRLATIYTNLGAKPDRLNLIRLQRIYGSEAELPAALPGRWPFTYHQILWNQSFTPQRLPNPDVHTKPKRCMQQEKITPAAPRRT
jgi:hypothetical protein